MSQEPVAIVGMGVLLPGAANVGQYWQNIITGTDAITDIPVTRWEQGFHGSTGTAPDQTYGRRGGFVPDTVDFDPLGFGIPPADVDGMEPDQLAALATAVAAIEDAGGFDRLGDRAKVGVILGRGGYLSPGLLRFDQRVRTIRQITRTVQELVPSAGPEVIERLRTALLEPLGEFRPQTAIGLVPNLAASRIANRLDLFGPAYTVDAACASSLVAVDQAIGELVRRRCDVVLAGGVHHTHDDTLWSMFTQIGALSPSQRISPLSQDADGLLIGEGTAIVMLKRLDDARANGDRVYAVLKGSGTSSDGKGASLLSPSVAGQVLALRRAWSAADLDPSSIGLLEAHGTATKAGDAAELATLTEVFGPADDGPRAVIGSVKSMIGHTLPTAGIAGLVKVALALHHRVLPPTLHCAEPNPLVETTRFRTIGTAEEWATDWPRRAAVNAFGFGGVNAHVVLEEADHAPKKGRARVHEPERVLRIAAHTADELLDRLDRPHEPDGAGAEGRFRIGIVGPTEPNLALARRIAAKVVAEGKPWRGAKDIWCTTSPLLQAPDSKTAFLFPGLEGDGTPNCADVARQFGLPAPSWSTVSLLDHAESVTHVGTLLHEALGRIGVAPDALAGHSVGEWTAMQVAGMYSTGPAADLVSRYWPDGFTIPDTEFLVLGCAAEIAEPLYAGLDIVLSHDNAPQQTIACGAPDAIRQLAEACRGAGVIARSLPFRSGVHTRYLTPHLTPFANLVKDLDFRASRIPMWSATTVAPYPTEPGAIRDLYLAHLVQKVRFRELIKTLYGEGFRAFIQVGAGQLGSFVSDTLQDAEHLVIGAASSFRSGLSQLRRVATAMWVEGAQPQFDVLEPRTVRLNTSSALLSLPENARGLLEPMVDIPTGVSDEIVAEFTALLAETRRSAASVIAAYAGNRTVETTVEVSLTAMPYLRDHRFFRQRAGWPDESDFWPVVPATALVDLACRQVEKAWPGTLAIGVQDATFARWLLAEPASTIQVSMQRDGDTVRVDLGSYAQLTVNTAATFPIAPMAPVSTEAETAPPLTAAEIYTNREMFHGPAYQGLAMLHGIGRGHIRGRLVVPPAPGALLDNVGQLLGCWMLANETENLLAFPRGIKRITWYAPEPEPGTEIECVAEIRAEPDLLEMTAHLILDGQVLARVENWRDVRFPCDRAAHRVYAYPDRNRFSTVAPDGTASVEDRWPSLAAREFYAAVYLNRAERTAYAACPPREQRGWLLRRIAIKDAVRALLGEPVYPAELHVHDDEKSVSGLHGRVLPPLSITVTSDSNRAHALATPLGSPA
ncbi:polyketide synthase dehydratase domain-containing protein [Kribbella sp. NBC_01505]|uniref:beta-ketoacyl synthase N-terminal-like domain-containing protein n=1 Tax=Kribbella sp. NBC_01505 TaxID=2903580 RepID=UPI00386DA0A9